MGKNKKARTIGLSFRWSLIMGLCLFNAPGCYATAQEHQTQKLNVAKINRKQHRNQTMLYGDGENNKAQKIILPSNDPVQTKKIPPAKPGFWDTNLLPPLTSRPELYGAPQGLQPTSNQTALFHQGPWGVFNANSGAAAGFGTVGYYSIIRWAEDWSNLRDPKNRIDIMDPLKYIPLNGTGSIYLTLSGNFRHHGMYDQKAFFGTMKQSPAYRSTLRWTAGADLHLGEHLRLYGELISGQAAGINYFGYTGGRWRHKLDAQQAFVEIKAHLLKARMGLLIGRMNFLDLPPYVSGGGLFPNYPLSFNGVRYYSFWKNFRVDLFNFTGTNTPYSPPFHYQVGYKTRLFGAYTSYALPQMGFMPKSSHIFIDTFYLGYLLANSYIVKTTGTQAGSTRRDTPGMRIWGNFGPWEFSFGGMYQGGYFHTANHGPTRSISAYSFNTQLSYRFSNLWGRPTLGIQADDISGGDTRKGETGSWGNFLSPWTQSPYYLDFSGYIINSNIIHVGPIASITPTKTTSLTLRIPAIWRNNVHDASYNIFNQSYNFRPQGSYVATIPQANFTWRFTRHVVLTLDGEYIFASKSMIRAGASSGAFVQSNLELTF